MLQSPKTIVDKMLAAFASGDVDTILETVSEDTIWIYHGTQIIPKGMFQGKEGVRKFFTGILNGTEMIKFELDSSFNSSINLIINGTEMIKFEPEQFVVQDDVVVILGNEHQRVKRSGKELKQKWVQVYTVNNNLITRMEEFASSERVGVEQE